jgi:putative ABC transport system permease protein
MRWLDKISLRLRSLTRRNAFDEELSQELQFHLERQVAENLASGMSREEALRSAYKDFGGMDRFKEECRDARGVNVVESLLADLRHGSRSLRRSPGFTAVCILTLALGLGANTAIFSMVNALLLRPYNFHSLDMLVRVWEDRGIDSGFDARNIAPADAVDLQSSTSVFDGLTTYSFKSFSLGAGENLQPILGCRVSANFFDLLGVAPSFGRLFVSQEEQPGSDQVAVISHGLWQRHFGADPRVTGKTLLLDGRRYTVVAVMPKDFDYPVPVELWVPLALTPSEQAERAQLSVQALARLKPGIRAAQARTALANFARYLQREYPETNAGRTATLLELRKELYSFTLPLFLLLQTAAVFVLLLACANLANLIFARMIGRRREIALRAALGAGRGRLAQLFISETLLLSTFSGLFVVFLSFWSVKALRTSISVEWTKWVPGWSGIQVDRNVLIFAMLLAVSVGIVFGLAIVLHTNRIEPNKTLKETGAGSIYDAKARLRGALVVAQVVVAMVLLVCGGLTIQGFMRLAWNYGGFEPANVLRFEISLPEKEYADPVKILAFYRQLLRGAGALAGVDAAALITNPPASNVDNDTSYFTFDRLTALKPSETPDADLQLATPDYLRALKIPLISGRFLSNFDNAGARRVVVVSRSFANRHFPGGDALNHAVKLGAANSPEPWLTIVGVVGDVRQNWWNPVTRPVIYEPFFQSPQGSMTVLLRSNSDPLSYVSSVRAIVQQIDPLVAMRGTHPLKEEISDSIAIVRIMGILMGIFGLVALVLSSLGVYGVLSESVAQRTREIGIRRALGGHPGDLMRLILGHALKLALIGLVIAIPISIAVSRAMASLIFGVVSMDWTVLAGFGALLLAVAVAAGYFPARRAMRLDPMVCLRYE